MKIVKIILRSLLVPAAIVYSAFMPLMSAAGWQYNVNEGNYPALFGAFATWMNIGSLLLIAAAVLVFFGIKPKFWQCNAVSIGCGCAGLVSCMTVLYRFTAYADQNFSGIDGTMQPVSELYRDRLLPMLLPFALGLALAVIQLLDYEARVYRRQKREEKKRLDAEEAPKILGE